MPGFPDTLPREPLACALSPSVSVSISLSLSPSLPIHWTHSLTFSLPLPLSISNPKITCPEISNPNLTKTT